MCVTYAQPILLSLTLMLNIAGKQLFQHMLKLPLLSLKLSVSLSHRADNSNNVAFTTVKESIEDI